MNMHTINRAGVSIEIDIDAISPDIIAKLIRHGMTQKIGDAAAGAKKIADETGVSVETVAESLMGKVRDALLAGDWGASRESSGVSVETTVWRMVARGAMKESLGAKSPKWAEFTGKSDSEQAEILDRIAERNREKLEPRFTAEMKRREIAQKARKTAVELDF